MVLKWQVTQWSHSSTKLHSHHGVLWINRVYTQEMGLEMAGHLADTGEEFAQCWVFPRQHFECRVIHMTWFWNARLNGWHWGRDCTDYVPDLSGWITSSSYSDTQEWYWNGMQLGDNTQEKLCSYCWGVPRESAELLKLVDLYLGDSLKTAGHLVVKLEGKDCMVSVEVFQHTELFNLVELNLEDYLEMAGNLVVTQGKTLHSCCRDLQGCEMHVFLCNFTKYLTTGASSWLH